MSASGRVIVTSGGALVVARGRVAERVLRLAEQAHLPHEFENVLTLMEKAAGPIKWRPFGGANRVAHSALGAASSSTHLLTEPIVNILDAELELAHLLAGARGEQDVPRSTYAAAERYFRIPSGGLAGWDVRRGPAQRRFRELAMRAQMNIRSGSRRDTPSLTYLDRAIGQHPAEFEATLLSLHLGNKAEIPYLAGQYGHGAGMTLSYSSGGQIIVARRHPELLADDEEDLVGLVLITRRMPSETGMTNPSYWYAVPAETEKVLAFAPTALSDPRWHGVRRTCIDYELAKHSERDIYMALDHYLPDPPLPYAFYDERKGEGWQWRLMSGNATRLESHCRGWSPRTGKHPTRVPYRQTTYVDLDAWTGTSGLGSIEVVTTFVRQEGTDRGNELFAPVKEAEVWTLNGQVHHTRTRNHFGVDPIRLDAIRDFIVVQAKLDSLTADAKANLLTTDRQGAAERKIKKQVEDAIDDVLANDETLRRLNDEVKDDALRDAANARMRDLDRELEEFDWFVRTERETVKRKVRRMRRRRTTRPPIVALQPIAPLHAEPSFVRFRKNHRQLVRIRPGATASILLEADAVDGYFDAVRQPSWQFLPPMGTALRVYSKERLVDGRMRVRMKAAKNAALGLTRLTASYLPPSATAPLSDTVAVEIVGARTRPVRSGRGRLVEVEVEEEVEVERRKPPPYQILFREHEPTWASKGMDHWTEETVGEFKNDVAYVNGDFTPLRRLLDDARHAQRQQYLSLYAAPVIMTLVGVAKEESDPPRDEDTDEPIALHDRYRTAGLQAVALSTVFTIRKLRRLGLTLGDGTSD